MYEMEGPRPVSRHVPADFSASFAPLDHLPGPGTLPVLRSRPGHRVARGFPAPWLRLSSLPTSRGFPQARWRRVFPQPVAQGFPLPIDRGFPQAKRLKPSLRRVAQGFLLITQLGVSPPPHNLKFSLRLRRRAFFSVRDSGFPLRHIPRSSPCATGPRFPLAGFPLARWHRAFPEAEGPRVCPIPGWPGVSPAPVAWSFLLAGGAGLLLARKPGVVLCRVARGFPFAGYRPWW